jgi:uncharacterized protein (TIGR04255 family)
MPFPSADRTVYRKNPLAEVICELRFPPILKIDVEHPAVFQEGIRVAYPLYEEQGTGLPANGIPPEVLALLSNNQAARQLTRRFVSADSVWRVTLGRESFAVSTRHYTRWEDFRRHLDEPLAVLARVYAPAFFVRVGLRYRNVIRRDRLNLQGRAWSELLRPHVAAEFGAPGVIEADVTHAAHEVRLALDRHESTVVLRHGLAKTRSSESVYSIDADFSRDTRTGVNDAGDVLDYFNERSRSLFRWCIQDVLHAAMEPMAP